MTPVCYSTKVRIITVLMLMRRLASAFFSVYCFPNNCRLLFSRIFLQLTYFIILVMWAFDCSYRFRCFLLWRTVNIIPLKMCLISSCQVAWKLLLLIALLFCIVWSPCGINDLLLGRMVHACTSQGTNGLQY